MITLLFLAVLVTVLVLVIRILIKVIRRKPFLRMAGLLGVVISGYTVLWMVFYFLRNDIVVPKGTDICFDDWCATVIRADTTSSLGEGINTPKPLGKFYIIHVKISNHARGIAQKPSEPRILVIDDRGNRWQFSKAGQETLERLEGKQPGIDTRLELHESKETKIVFDLPQNTSGLKILIEEGPAITNLLFPQDRGIFLL